MTLRRIPGFVRGDWRIPALTTGFLPSTCVLARNFRHFLNQRNTPRGICTSPITTYGRNVMKLPDPTGRSGSHDGGAVVIAASTARCRAQK